MAKKPFKGIIKLDVRDSVPDWEPYLPTKAPAGAPNILFVLYDDTGLAAWSPFGGRINMPTLQKLADHGLMYSQWHTTALCSPTRSTLLTGRNHHLNGMAAITEGANGFPGANGRIPDECATIGADPPGRRLEHVLARQEPQRAGAGHRLGREPQAVAAAEGLRPLLRLPRRRDQPVVSRTSSRTTSSSTSRTARRRAITSPRISPTRRIGMIRDQKASNPSRPWYMWFCPGANHAPHHARRTTSTSTRASSTTATRRTATWVLPRMIAKGILPKGTQLTPLNPMPSDMANPADMVRPWDSLNADEKKLFSRLMEVYAGFSEYTDAQVGRIIDYLEQSGQLENTVVLYAADNGASGEGSPNGSVNENKFFNGYPDELSENMKLHRRARRTGHLRALSDRLGRGHLDAVQDVQALLGVRRRHVRPAGHLVAEGHQGARRGAQPVSPLAPTSSRRSSTSAGWRCPRSTRASSSIRSSGVSMRYTLRRGRRADAEEAPVLRDARHARRSGRTAGRPSPSTPRSRARATSTRTCGSSTTSTSIRAESKDLAKEHPEKLQALIKAWFEEADKNLVLPLDDRTRARAAQTSSGRPRKPPRERYIYYPGTSPVPEGVAVNVRGRSYKILADVEITDPNCSGVIFAHGSRFGGHSLFIKDKKLYYVYNFLGIKPEQQFVSPELKPGKYTLGMEFTREKAGPVPRVARHDEALRQRQGRGRRTDARAGRASSRCPATVSASATTAATPSARSTSRPATFKGGTILGVGVTVEKAQYLDLEKMAAAAFAVD